MANLGNAWHLPLQPEPAIRATMREPVGALVPGSPVTVTTGNQFAGVGGNPGNQLQAGSALLFRREADVNWTTVPMAFLSTVGNNKYYQATILPKTFAAGDVVHYYIRIPYSDHDTTFLAASGAGSTTTADEAAAQRAPFTFAVQSSSVRGEWGPVFGLPNVGIHAHVLPSGEVLMWGRREGTDPMESLDEHSCTPFLWNPATGGTRNTSQPKLADGTTTVNLFCSGHTFLPDGRLLVAGGHLFDAVGLPQAAIYDPQADTWTATALMNNGRWYPTATSLPDGTVLVISGSITSNVANFTPQVWNNGQWLQIAGFPNQRNNAAAFPLFPRMHVAASGKVFMSGSEAMTWCLDISGGGSWKPVAARDNAQRDYAPSVMYDVDKVLYIGGGNDQPTQAPTANAEIIDLAAAAPQWTATAAMQLPRRQHNATILPDGTVLVTGGTRGGGGPNQGFNDLTPGAPVHVAERWDPKTGQWTEMAAELVDRCYHATAVLLPDGRVLSAGGGEYRPTSGPNAPPNDPKDSHRDAQIFTPPYLFEAGQPAARPQITSAPNSVGYGAVFEVQTPQPDQVQRASLVRLSSVTHSFNMNQRINFLSPQVDAGKLKLTAPASPGLCPPGHYLLFILNAKGVPSVGHVIQVTAAAGVAPGGLAHQGGLLSASRDASDQGHFPDALERREAVRRAARGTPVTVGISGTCPYGIGACWGGAHEALLTLDGVDVVDPIPNGDQSTADLFLEDERLPALGRWQDQFHQLVNGSYKLRGVEVTLEGRVESREGTLVLTGHDARPTVELSQLDVADKVQWDATAGGPRSAEPSETTAYERLSAESGAGVDGRSARVTGPLKASESGYRLEVRQFIL